MAWLAGPCDSAHKSVCVGILLGQTIIWLGPFMLQPRPFGLMARKRVCATIHSAKMVLVRPEEATYWATATNQPQSYHSSAKRLTHSTKPNMHSAKSPKMCL